MADGHGGEDLSLLELDLAAVSEEEGGSSLQSTEILRLGGNQGMTMNYRKKN